MIDPQVLSRLLRSTVKIGWINDEGILIDLWTGFIIGKVGPHAIILTTAHAVTEEELQNYYFGISFEDSLHPEGSLKFIYPCEHQVYIKESEILLLSAPTDLAHDVLKFASEREWGLIYGEKLWALSHPCELEWVLTKGRVTRPGTLNGGFLPYDPKMIVFHHNMSTGPGSSGAAIVNVNGSIVGMQSGDLGDLPKTVSGDPLEAALGRIKTLPKDNQPKVQKYIDNSINLRELKLEQKHVEQNRYHNCGIKLAVHVEYIDKTIRDHFKFEGTGGLTLNELVQLFVMEKIAA